MRSKRRARPGVVVVSALALMATYAQTSTGAPGPDLSAVLEQSRIKAEAINDADVIPEVVQNLVPGALERRDVALAQYKTTTNPNPLSRPEYEWQPGQPVVAGHLFTDLTSVWDVSAIPNITLKN
ncbi:MAG TPA: hypothetical protein VGL92_13430, partial [Acidimicrobiia bacterium]